MTKGAGAVRPITKEQQSGTVHLGDVRIALLGLGRIGSAVARLALDLHTHVPHRASITGALVRDTGRHPAVPFGVTADGRELLNTNPDVVVEVLGGLEPARSLVLEALARGIPVVTANKSLLAVHGDELLGQPGEPVCRFAMRPACWLACRF